MIAPSPLSGRSTAPSERDKRSFSPPRITLQSRRLLSTGLSFLATGSGIRLAERIRREALAHCIDEQEDRCEVVQHFAHAAEIVHPAVHGAGFKQVLASDGEQHFSASE